jgi:hypothetical protein
MFCNECGTQNPDTNRFCKNCGKPLPQRQPAAQPAVPPAPAPVAPAAPAGAFMQQAPVPAPAAVPKRKRNWLGFLSLVSGLLSWGILTVILAILAVLLGIVSLVWFRKATGRIGITSIIGTILGIAAIVALVMLA